ncbi:MAG: hypothetical protein FWC71_10580 [Defluviitaleaceae bacterium]|nr:hypothetical protein [Defluviitaleaceae bacterium]
MTQAMNYYSNAPQMERKTDGYAIKPVRNTMQLISMVNGIVGGALLVVSAILFFVSFAVGDYPGAVMGLRWAAIGVAFGGIIECTISVIFRAIVRKQQNKLELLKTTGINYSATITRIVPRHGVTAGGSRSVHAECTYTNNEGKTCLVKSNSFMYANAAYNATVYVNPHDPHDYAVEVYTAPHTSSVEHDYR